MGFRYRTWAAVLIGSLALGGAARALIDREPQDRISAEWRDLAERCIASVERSAPFDASDLEAFTPPPALRADIKFRRDHQRAWIRNGSRFAVVETDLAKRPAAARSCSIVLATTYDSLNEVEQGALIRTFLLLRRDLLSSSRYETPDLAQIHPLIMLFARSIGRNARSCQTVILLTLDPENRAVRLIIGERQDAPCRRPGTGAHLDEPNPALRDSLARTAAFDWIKPTS
ncbi:hypothetical protein [Methylopila sp. Yamaguchi]|uniref:hypothetical protein n=1 Tax=Methylopila sp. Yamaguchi TaxID=1437817 RepID=UPI000CBDAB69|nr:hypothetical protein [Methylopila sp. Yamaguchi]GBD48234.1 hypothetical protein METY_1447 [Methylopila sp. Yamaguchi]